MLMLRVASATDIDVMVDLLSQLFSIEQDFTPDAARQSRGLKRLLEACDAYIAVAELDGVVVGMASLQTRISTAEGGCCGLIEDVVVDASHRGRGIGKALLDHLVEVAERKGLAGIRLLADRDNKTALDFYDRHGWSATNLLALTRKIR